MPRKPIAVGNLALAKFDDIFTASTGNPNGECIVQIPLCDLHAPEFHPFIVQDDDAMNRIDESVKDSGIRAPGLARPRADGGYELMRRFRRRRACELAELSTMPVIIRELDDNLATIFMVDSNLDQREKILPSEKAWAYKVMMEALKHNGVRGDNHSYEIMVERTGESKNQIFRIIRMTELIVTLLDKVDANQLAFNPAVELSYLSQKEQTAVADAMVAHGVKPSLSQSVRLKKMKQSGTLTIELIHKMLSEEKKPPKGEPSGSARYRQFFPTTYSPKQIDAVIKELLTDWRAKTAV